MSHEAVNIKGTKNGLVIVLDPDYSFEDLKIKLQEKIVSAKGFFQGAKFTLKAQKISQQESEELQEICCEHGLIPADTIELPRAVNDNLSQVPHHTELSDRDKIALVYDNCFLINRSIRSGQKIQHDGHITILGDVNKGAEVIAGGNILVMGTLRGVAHAGASGNRDAVIVSYRLEPTQLRIGDIVARSPEKNENHDYPERAYLDGNTIVIEPYTTSPTRTKKKALI